MTSSLGAQSNPSSPGCGNLRKPEYPAVRKPEYPASFGAVATVLSTFWSSSACLVADLGYA